MGGGLDLLDITYVRCVQLGGWVGGGIENMPFLHVYYMDEPFICSVCGCVLMLVVFN